MKTRKERKKEKKFARIRKKELIPRSSGDGEAATSHNPVPTPSAIRTSPRKAGRSGEGLKALLGFFSVTEAKSPLGLSPGVRTPLVSSPWWLSHRSFPEQSPPVRRELARAPACSQVCSWRTPPPAPAPCPPEPGDGFWLSLNACLSAAVTTGRRRPVE